MSVTIRLSRRGKRNAPAYKIVVAQTRDKRDGKFLDIIGHYNPSENPPSFSYDKEKFEKWMEQGALITDAVKKLIEGTYEYVPYEPKKEGANEGSAEAKKEAPAQEPEAPEVENSESE